MTTAARIAGIELGGTKCVVLLADAAGSILEQRRVPTADPSTTLRAIEALLDDWRFDAIGLAAFGPLDLDPASPDFGSVTATPKAGWRGTDLAGRFARRYARPVAIQTDVNAAALAEGRWGAAQGLAHHGYVTIGTGVGVGWVAQGRPLMGVAHGEAGHMRVPRLPGDRFAGNCPFHADCVEGLIAGPALAARAGRPGEALPDDAPEWEPFVAALAAMLHNLVLTLMPERVAIGGGVVTGRAALFPRLRARLRESLGGYGGLADWATTLDARIGPPGLGDRAGPLGAVALGLDALAGQ